MKELERPVWPLKAISSLQQFKPPLMLVAV